MADPTLERRLGMYGRLSFAELGRDVHDAQMASRHDYDFGDGDPGHVIVGTINFNSLNRIATKYADSSASELSRLKEAASFHEHNWTRERDLKVAAIKHAKEAEARLARAVEVMRANWNKRFWRSVTDDQADIVNAFLSEQENRHGNG